jgi:hypothetical protein
LLLRASLVAALFGAAGCENDLGDSPPGSTIRGEITYAGARTFENPILLITVLSKLGGTGSTPPYGLLALYGDEVNQDGPTPFQIDFIPDGSFYLLAVIGEQASFDPSADPKSSYPNACVLAFMPPTRSFTLPAPDGESISYDMTIYDSVTSDPCFAALRGMQMSGSQSAAQPAIHGDLGNAEKGE